MTGPERLRLGRSDLEISRIGFGSWAIGGPGREYRGTREHDDRSIEAMLHAFELGVNWVDTAPVYGKGHSEELVGKAIKMVSGERPLVFTKCGLIWDERDRMKQSRRVLEPASIRAECELCKPFGVATWRTTGAVRDIRVRALTAEEKKAAEKK